NTEVLDFMHGWKTSRHEGCVSTMLTNKRLKYCTGSAPLQGSMRRNGGCKTESTALRGVFGLDKPGPAQPIARPAARSHVTPRRVRRQEYLCLIFKRFARGLSRRARCCSAETARDRSEKDSR